MSACRYILRITAPHFCAAVITYKGRIVEAAPILGWSVGKKLYDLNRWCEQKGYQTSYIPIEEPRHA